MGLPITLGWCQEERGCAVGQDAYTANIHQCLQVGDSRDVESTYEEGVSVRESSQRIDLPSIELDRGGVGCGGLVNGRSPPMPIRAGSHRTNPRVRSPINPFTLSTQHLHGTGKWG